MRAGNDGAFTSESSISPRVTFKLRQDLVRKDPAMRNTFEISCVNEMSHRIYIG